MVASAKAARDEQPVVGLPDAIMLPDEIDLDCLAGWTVTLDNHLTVLLDPAAANKKWTSDKPPELRKAVLLRYDGTAIVERLELERAGYPWCSIDRLTNGAWILKSHAVQAEQDQGQLIRPDGTWIPLALGSEVEHLQADPDGGFWVAYHERAILGFADTSDAIDLGGLVRFSAEGERMWGYNDEGAEAGLFTLYDVQCLNMSRHGRFAHIWKGYQIAEFREQGNPLFHRVRSGYVSAFAVDGESFLTLADGVMSNATVTLRLIDPPNRGSSRRSLVRWTAVLDSEFPYRRSRCLGRGDRLHFLSDKGWHSVSLADANQQISIEKKRAALVGSAQKQSL